MVSLFSTQSTEVFRMKPSRRRHFCRLALACLSCALCLSALSATAQELGRLFFTPERRQALDRQRESRLILHREAAETAEAAEESALTIDGVVTRSSGRRTVWINGIARDGEDIPVTPSRANPGRIVVRTPDGVDAEASVGDTVDRNTGETAGLLGGGQIRIKPAPRR
jgi:hypothetical protein